MELTKEQVLNIIREPKNPVIAANTKLQNEHKIHIEGTGFENALKEIVGYETTEQFNQKKLITKPFTRPIYQKILNAQSRWKTAQGTSRYYKFKKDDETTSKTFREEVLGEAWKGGSIEDFVKEFLSKAIYEEFNGFFVVEKGAIVKDGNFRYEKRGNITRRMKANEKLKPYICFYASEDIYNFKLTGKKVEYLAFKFKEETVKVGDTEKKYTFYRVIDDNYDYIVRKEGNDKDSVTFVDEYRPFQHNVGRAPVCPVSTLKRSLKNEDTKTSPIDHVIELMDYLLHQFGEHVATNILHAHPIYYQVGQTCTYKDDATGNCCDKGRIFTDSPDPDKAEIICPACKGVGVNQHRNASTVLTVPAFDKEGKAFNITNIAGYATFPTEALEYQQSAIDWMEKKIVDASLGMANISNKDTTIAPTATEVMQVNIKPLEDIISDIIDIVEYDEELLTDFLGRMWLPDKYLGCEILYGRQLNLRDENVLISELSRGKAAGVPMSYIKAISEELVYSRFGRSESDQDKNIMLMQLEPLAGFTFSEVNNSKSITEKTKILKQNFTDYITKFEEENGPLVAFMADAEYKTKIAKIKEVLDGYVKLTMEELKAAIPDPVPPVTP